MLAEPFEKFTFSPSGTSVFHLGNYGSAAATGIGRKVSLLSKISDVRYHHKLVLGRPHWSEDAGIAFVL
jgi:hypothetical protein